MLKIAMISQPMNGRSDEEITKERENLIKELENKGYQYLDTYQRDYVYDTDTKNKPISYLANSIKYMSQCDAVFFTKGWEEARGCKIEHTIAKEYGLEIIYF